MEPASRPLLLLAILAAVILVSGCTGFDPEAIAKSNSMIQQFLSEHPNAQIVVTHFTANQSKYMIDQIRSDCDNPYLDEKEFYRVNITDPDTNFYAIVWIDWEAKTVECVFKIGTEGKMLERPNPGNCTNHASSKCYNSHIYWFDSCGNVQDKKEYCKQGCSEDKCLGDCKSQAEFRCYGDHVYWFDSCGNKQEKKEYCDYGCENGFCKARPAEMTCSEAGGYCIYPGSNPVCGNGICESGEANPSITNCPAGAECVLAEGTCPQDCPQVQTATSAGGGGQSAATGMMVNAETSVSVETTATSTVVTYQCKSGYGVSPNYFCKEGGMCCIPVEEFCGSSTQGPCSSDSECRAGGCSGQQCNSVNEVPPPTTCEWKDCYNADKYGMQCKCVGSPATIAGNAGKCMWTKTDSSPNRKCSATQDCIATCAYGCVNAEWMKGREDCAGIPSFACACINGVCQRTGQQCSSEGQFCGGIAAIQCCSGLTCQLDGTYPDAGGTCIKQSTPSITVLSPNGGESWAIGSTQTISWSSANAPNGSWVALSLTDGPFIAQGLPVTGSYSWKIPTEYCGGDVCGFQLQPGSNYKIDARLYSGPSICLGFCPPTTSRPTLLSRDYSDAPFSIVSANLTCTDSDGGKNYYVKGTTTFGSTSQTDSCIDCIWGDGVNGSTSYSCWAVLENYCDGNSIKSEVYVCPSGCSNGACINVCQENVPCTITQGQTAIITSAGGNQTSITLISVSTWTSAVIAVNGIYKTVTTGESYIISGNNFFINGIMMAEPGPNITSSSIPPNKLIFTMNSTSIQ